MRLVREAWVDGGLYECFGVAYPESSEDDDSDTEYSPPPPVIFSSPAGSGGPDNVSEAADLDNKNEVSNEAIYSEFLTLAKTKISVGFFEIVQLGLEFLRMSPELEEQFCTKADTYEEKYKLCINCDSFSRMYAYSPLVDSPLSGPERYYLINAFSKVAPSSNQNPEITQVFQEALRQAAVDGGGLAIAKNLWKA